MLHWPNDHLNRRLLDVDIILLDCRPLGNVSEIGGVKAECYHAHHSECMAAGLLRVLLLSHL